MVIQVRVIFFLILFFMYNIDMSNWVPIIVNLLILLVTLSGTLFLITKVKFEDGNYKLLFVLYLMY